MSMLKKIKLSIIIPVYGVEKFIKIFLDSILPQLNNQVELIFVNDGCKDNSITILSREISQLPLIIQKNIKIINQENTGVSGARNTGLKSVHGLYITFLDPDDYVMGNYISSILETIELQDFDILHFNIKKIMKNNDEFLIKHVNKTQQKVICNNYLSELTSLNIWFSCVRVIHQKLLTDFHFPEGFVFEDILSLPFLYKAGLKIYELDEALVTYQYRSDSITNEGVNTNLLNSLMEGIIMYRNKRNEVHLRSVYFHLIMILFDYKLKSGKQAYFKFIENIEETDLVFFRQYLDGTHWKKKLMINYPRAFFYYKNRINLAPQITLKN